MNILITGVHGFIGSNLVSALKNQHTLYGLDIISPHNAGVFNTFNWSDFDTLPPVDIIIHLAGKAHDTRDHTKAQSYFDINTGLTQKIFEWFLKSAATKFIFFSTVKAAADSVEGKELTEEVVPHPKGPYGESKLAAEKYILQNIKTDKQVYILRPCMIHGPGNKGNMNLLYKIQQKGLPWPLGAFENKRSFCSIDNLLFTVQQIIDQYIEPGIYQVSDDDALSTNELIRLMAGTQNKKARIWNIPAGLLKTFAKFGDFVHLPLNSERLKKLTESYVVSNSKIKQALKIDKMPVTAVAGLQKTFESFTNKD
jgi:nucleoside-diphosphate-sugar epimerase